MMDAAQQRLSPWGGGLDAGLSDCDVHGFLLQRPILA